MKAAVVTQAGAPPIWSEFDDPLSLTNEAIIDVVAAALTQLTRGRASGQHYSTNATSGFIAGIDGVGWDTDGRPTYFVLPRAPYGTMAEYAPVPRTQTIAVPDKLDPVQAAAMANPGMSSWVALAERAKIATGETVLINGATGAAGRLAVTIARHMGASRIIATGRDETALADLNVDEVLVLSPAEETLQLSFTPHFAKGVDIVLDYLWGVSARAALIAAAKHGPDGRRLRFVQIGTASATEIALPGAVLRSSAIELMGSGIGSVGTDRLLASIADLFEAATASKWGIPIRPMPMEEVRTAWSTGSQERIVLTL